MRLHELLVLLALAAPATLSAQGGTATFDALVRRHLAERARRSPEWSTSVGVHLADNRLDDRSATARAGDSARVATELARLRAIDTNRLDQRRRVDWLLLRSALETSAQDVARREWQRRPGGYVPFGAVYGLLTASEPAGPVRMRSLVTRLERFPGAIALGRQQIIAEHTPPFWVDLDAGSARRIAQYLRTELPREAKVYGADSARLARAIGVAAPAVEQYATWLRDTLRAQARGEWAYGTRDYDYRLRHSKLLGDADSDSLIRLGSAAIRETRAQLEALAREIDPSRTWQQLADSSKGLHPSADSVFAAYRAESQRARRFIIEKGLFDVPAGERLDMVLTPPNLRQTYAYGGYSSAAPFEKRQVGRFFVTPVEPGSTPQQVESKLRGHNYGWITVVALHEGYPGHHLQYTRAAKQPNVLRKVYGSEVFGEGWGLYSEELMWRNGFFPSPLARLTQLRMRMWRAARVVIDPSLHTRGMSVDQAVQFFVDTVGLERSDALAEVTRYTTWPTQAVSYIVGHRAIDALRDELKERLGARFDLKRFHSVLLDEGSLPPPLMRRAVLATLGLADTARSSLHSTP
ncbi:MAG: DUF885 domain-containing protein [Gemmatimonadaceae bacterium]|nr:DUF885 domain-containing protein [Gemmatimonadaceae bacterium]